MRPRKRKRPASEGLAGHKKMRQRPTLPHGFPCSTIGSGGLNFRVRDGNGCDPTEIATANLEKDRQHELPDNRIRWVEATSAAGRRSMLPGPRPRPLERPFDLKKERPSLTPD